MGQVRKIVVAENNRLAVSTDSAAGWRAAGFCRGRAEIVESLETEDYAFLARRHKAFDTSAQSWTDTLRQWSSPLYLWFMRLLLFSDLHCDVGAAETLAEMAQDADVLVGAGDFGNVRRGVEMCLDVLRSVERPAVLVPGNNESYEELVVAAAGWKTARVLHASSCEIGKITFFGLGGGIPTTPFGDWSFDFTENEAEKMLSGCSAGCVLVSHSPPKGMVDVSSSGHSLGSVAVRRAVENKHPQLVVCGHVHASAGQEGKIGRTPVVNAGPNGLFWDLLLPK